MSSATAFCSSRVQSFASLAIAAWTVAESVPADPPPDAPPSTPPTVPLFTVLPTRLNWLRMAPATPGPANTITRPMTAMIGTYSMIPWPPEADASRRYPPPGGSAPLHAYATLPSLSVNRNELSVGLSRESVFVLPLRHLDYCHALGRITPGTFLSESLCSVFGLMFQSEQSRWRLRHCSDIPV